jgi:hypothetical protein
MNGQVARTGEIIYAYSISVGKSDEKRLLGSMILKGILKEKGVRMWTGFIWLRIGTSGGLL